MHATTNFVRDVSAASDSELAFEPQLTPKEMLEMGVFGGWYFEGDYAEFPDHWFVGAKLSNDGYRAELNRFGVTAGREGAVWMARGWTTPEDPLGWFQWYCRYSMGRRLPDVDAFQIRRWRGFGASHIPKLKRDCAPGDLDCHPHERQALLQWAYDPFI